MYPRTLLALSLVVLGGLSSCDKESLKPTLPSIKTATELVMANTWKVTAVTEKKGTEPVKNLYSDVPTCFRDNLYSFQAGGVFVMDEGLTRCASADPQTRTGSWTQSNSGMTLSATVAPATQSGTDVRPVLTGTIESISTTEFVLAVRDTTGRMTTITRTTLTAQ